VLNYKSAEELQTGLHETQTTGNTVAMEMQAVVVGGTKCCI